MSWRFAITDQCMASRCLYCTRAGISGYLTLTALPVPTPVFGKTSARIAQAHDNDVNYRQANELQESTRAMTMTDDRYRTLLGAFSAVADQPTVKAVLHSLRGVLASTSKLHGVELYLLSNDGQTLASFEFDRDDDAPAIKVGAKLLRIGAVAKVLDE
jgi:hypothetical protein